MSRTTKLSVHELVVVESPVTGDILKHLITCFYFNSRLFVLFIDVLIYIYESYQWYIHRNCYAIDAAYDSQQVNMQVTTLFNS